MNHKGFISCRIIPTWKNLWTCLLEDRPMTWVLNVHTEKTHRYHCETMRFVIQLTGNISSSIFQHLSIYPHSLNISPISQHFSGQYPHLRCYSHHFAMGILTNTQKKLEPCELPSVWMWKYLLSILFILIPKKKLIFKYIYIYNYIYMMWIIWRTPWR